MRSREMGVLLEYDIVWEAFARLQCKIHDKVGPGSCVFLKMSTPDNASLS